MMSPRFADDPHKERRCKGFPAQCILLNFESVFKKAVLVCYS